MQPRPLSRSSFSTQDSLDQLLAWMLHGTLYTAPLDFLIWHQRYALRFMALSPHVRSDAPTPYPGFTANLGEDVEAENGKSAETNRGNEDHVHSIDIRWPELGSLFGVVSLEAIDSGQPSLADYLHCEREELARIAEQLSTPQETTTISIDAAQTTPPPSPLVETGMRQPFRQECEEVWKHFIASTTAKMPLSDRHRQETRALLNRTTHPAVFSVVAHQCQREIINYILPRFIRGGARNIGSFSRWWRRLVGATTMLISLGAVFWMVFSVPDRWPRLMAAPIFWVGLAVFMQGNKVQLHASNSNSNGNDNSSSNGNVKS
ncbi:hypothetical protein THASP1DRAFT_22915 [Thamnocephalis sphaerospora]|uniref:RGS domain-containing protein n=1 Tax=Thamnocephalis sphaerospora TaxID=78915 RepID=A0A4P9XSW5_9FUNG|nr:hypothetical protein THASP1DRAFT_22915 [Thamnocephalis sphaerospora]|eukprot:RKP09216.1 hypothetical protein THASP1DRAFT_22915 [Thamnocephalis sphaerospora]